MSRRLVSSSLCTAALVASLGACANWGGERAMTGECPSGEVCSPATPRGLYFGGAPITGWSRSSDGPSPTAIGGTQEIRLMYNPDGGNQIFALDLPYRAITDGTPVQVETTDGHVVTVRGTADGEDYLRIVDPETDELYDRYSVEGRQIQEIALEGTRRERVPPGTEDVWATGRQTVAIGLHGFERLVDTSMTVDIEVGYLVEWDAVELMDAQVGVYPVTVTAGNKPPTVLELEIVAGPTEIVSLSGSSPTFPPDSGIELCFAAMHGTRYVHGLTWSFRVNGAPLDHMFWWPTNCVQVSDTGESNTYVVEASAGGKTLTVTARVVDAARVADDAALPAPGRDAAVRSEPAAGERARLAAGS